MKSFLFAALLLCVGVVAGCQSAHAQLTPEHTGHYYDPTDDIITRDGYDGITNEQTGRI